MTDFDLQDSAIHRQQKAFIREEESEAARWKGGWFIGAAIALVWGCYGAIGATCCWLWHIDWHTVVTPDFINGAFELLGGVFVLNHCRTVWKDREVKGVSILSTIFFSGWGLWNLFYYPHLGQWWSFGGGLAIVSANALWIGLMLKFRGSL